MMIKKIKTAQFIKKGYSPYHAMIAADPKKVIASDFAQKKAEILKVSPRIRFKKPRLKVAVLGCADSRYVQYYQDFFSDILEAECDLDIYELTTQHLPKQANIIKHDCTKPLPKKYDLVYTHLLINFLEPEQQKEMVTNSYKSLKPNGVALHVYASNKDSALFKMPLKTIKVDTEAKKCASKLASRAGAKRLILQKSQPYF